MVKTLTSDGQEDDQEEEISGEDGDDGSFQTPVKDHMDRGKSRLIDEMTF